YPATEIDFDGRTASLPGFGLDFRADGLRLSDDLGLALHFRWDYWFESDDFQHVSFFEIGVGVRFS
ncbi:MAG: hypothetical protein L6Q71_02205, partial [Planctomycetes bacterium]|nr:hypothetical protein [Planctomycetota bacterium]